MGEKIRVAKLEDTERMLEIYSPFVQSTPISFEVEVPGFTEFSNRMRHTMNHFPWLVYEVEGAVVAYTYASEHRSRYAYSWSCDSAVYVDSNYKRKGFGRRLYQSLFSCLKIQGYFNVFAGVVRSNKASIGLHKALGFEKVGTYQNVGFKFDKWYDVSWYQLKLRSKKMPTPLTPFYKVKNKL